MLRFLVLILSIFIFNSSYSQHKNHKKRILLLSQTAVYSSSLLALNQLWYKEYPKSSFHFVNDNNEWMKMDKLGHAVTSYNMGVAGIDAYRWAGYNDVISTFIGGFTGSIFLTSLEILDGFSKEWGASPGDLLSNSIGSIFCILEEKIWDEQKIILKYSFQPSSFSKQNPRLLGRNLIEQSIKDYNGQTYWASFNIKSLFLLEDTKFPDWLNIAFGYSIQGMISPVYNHEDDLVVRKQYLASLDIDLNKINTNIRFLNRIIHTFGFIKIPAPTLEISNSDVKLHYIY